MTPKEQAKELVDRYINLYFHPTEQYLDSEEAKLCALICVEEIIENRDAEQLPISYWKQVKKEIEQL